jgi:hypothetical protein
MNQGIEIKTGAPLSGAPVLISISLRGYDLLF